MSSSVGIRMIREPCARDPVSSLGRHLMEGRPPLSSWIRCGSFIHTVENRHVVIVAFGHGTQRWPWPTAGKPADSPEVQGILENIARHHPRAGIRIRDSRGSEAFPGHPSARRRAESLPEQLLRHRDRAPRASGDTRRHATLLVPGGREPLDRLSPTTLRVSIWQVFTAGDLPALRQQLANRNPAVYELVQKLFYHLFEVYPDFGRQVNLADAIRWVADAYCEKRELAGGVIILFDEFSAFLRSCVERPNATGHSTPLQDLLNGVVDRPRKVVFVAFAQYDPNAQVADLLRRTGNESAVRISARSLPAYRSATCFTRRWRPSSMLT